MRVIAGLQNRVRACEPTSSSPGSITSLRGRRHLRTGKEDAGHTSWWCKSGYATWYENMAENVAHILVGALMVQNWVCHMVGRGSFGAQQVVGLILLCNSIINSILAFPTFLVGNVYGMPHGMKTGHATWYENKVQLGHITG